MYTFRRIAQVPRQSFFLFGMRGVGKSTWARAALPDATHVDLLDERLYQDLLVDPSQFAASLRHLAANDWVVVDEVQRLPALLNEVHRLIESRRLRFALLGSSARKLKAAGVNLLAGRTLKKTMHPLTPAELGDEFDLARVLRHGSLPLWCGRARTRPLSSTPTRSSTCARRSAPKHWCATCRASCASSPWPRC